MEICTDILNFLEDIVFEVDENYRITYINFPSKILTGKTPDAMAGKKCYSALFGLSETCAECQISAIKNKQIGKSIIHDTITHRGFRKLYSADFFMTKRGTFIERIKDITDSKKMVDKMNHHLKEVKAKNVMLTLQKKETEKKRVFLEKILNSTEEGILVAKDNFDILNLNYRLKTLSSSEGKGLTKCYEIYGFDSQCTECPFTDKKITRSSRKVGDKVLTVNFNLFDNYLVESVRDTTKELYLLEEIKKQQEDLHEKQHQMQALNKDLLKMNDKLKEAQRVIDEELKQVGEIQSSLLPRNLPDISGFDFGAFYTPAEQAGGDYYDIITMSNGYFGFTVADVSGHGTPAAVIMAITRAIMRSYTYDVISSSEALAMINEILCDNIYTTDFVTMFYIVMDSSTSKCNFASAGHNPVLFFDKDEMVVKRLTASGLFLGTFDDVEFEEGVVHLDNGDILFMYTDGLVEAMDRDSEQYGYDRLISKLIMFQNEKCSVIIENIMTDLKEFASGRPFDDDITILVIKKED